MNEFDATELAYKNGYLCALLDLRKELAKDVDNYDDICNKLLSYNYIEKRIEELADDQKDICNS